MSAPGTLLLAGPELHDPNFTGTVVLVTHHDDEGTIGVVLNRPSVSPVGDHLPAWAARAADPAVVFVGGPVQPETAVALVENGWDLPGWTSIVGGIGLAELDPELEPEVPRLRVFSGYAGWGPGQLAAEMTEGAWILAEGHPDDPLTPDPEGLWRRVIRRQPGLSRIFADYPDDPSLN